MKFLRVVQNDTEFLMNVDCISTVSKTREAGEYQPTKFDFDILLKGERKPITVHFLGEGGRKIEFLKSIRNILEGK